MLLCSTKHDGICFPRRLNILTPVKIGRFHFIYCLWTYFLLKWNVATAEVQSNRAKLLISKLGNWSINYFELSFFCILSIKSIEILYLVLTWTRSQIIYWHTHITGQNSTEKVGAKNSNKGLYIHPQCGTCNELKGREPVTSHVLQHARVCASV